MRKKEFQVRARFRHALKQAQVPAGATLLVAVSGGCDSVSLLRFLHREAPGRGWKLIAGHIDHGLRPESGQDAAWVRDLAHELSLPFRGLRVSSGFWVKRPGASTEELARLIRRKGLRRLARQAGAEWILLGHTLDDQAETVLLNLLRGSGPHGLAGMAACRLPWLRPLLSVRRDDLRECARSNGWTWREDPTNDDPRFLRNRIRMKLLPLLQSAFRPGAPAVLARTAETLRPVCNLLEELAMERWNEVCIEESPARIRLERLRLTSYHQAVLEEILRTAFRRLRGSARDLKRAHLSAMVRALRMGRHGEVHLPAGMTAILDRQEICFSHPTEESDARP